MIMQEGAPARTPRLRGLHRRVHTRSELSTLAIGNRPCQLDTRPQVELAKDMTEMEVDSMPREVEHCRCFQVGPSFSHRQRHSSFGTGQTGPAAYRSAPGASFAMLATTPERPNNPADIAGGAGLLVAGSSFCEKRAGHGMIRRRGG